MAPTGINRPGYSSSPTGINRPGYSSPKPPTGVTDQGVMIMIGVRILS
jgi:hypothetical protein